MLTKLRKRLTMRHSDEDGLTLVEVIVAMMIFTVISVAVLYTMTNLLSVSRDSRNRQVAANLAAQEIDLARDVSDIFEIGTYDHVVALNGDSFTVTRNQDWVYSTGGTAACGAGAGALRYKFVEVVVTWNGMRGHDGVKSETFINPNERINDPAKGTLIIGVKGFQGEGVENVPVTATPTSGAAVTGTTDSDGCAFFLGLTPGTFTVKVSSPPSSSYVDQDGVAQPAPSATVVAGTSTSVPFTYAPSGTLRATYVAAGARVPFNLPTSLLSTRDPMVSVATAAANPRSFLIPSWDDGYSVIAGNAKQCYANDPTRWAANGSKANGEPPEPVMTLPSTTVDALVPMGSLAVTGVPTTGNGSYLIAISKSLASNGQPDCLVEQILRFPQNSGSTTMNVLLPYGSWEIYKGNNLTFIASGGTKITSGMTPGPGGSISSNVVTFDPRGPAS